MTDNRIVLDTAAFLDSPQAIRIDNASTKDIREITQRFLTACYNDLGKAPRLMDGDELSVVLRELLPRHFGKKDPLAEATESVLPAYLDFLADTEIVSHAFEQGQAVDQSMSAFQQAVATGAAHQDGVAVTGRVQTVKHRAQKVGRNDPCPCGSGKKFKKCCMNLGS